MIKQIGWAIFYFVYGILTAIGMLIYGIFGYSIIMSFPVKWIWDYIMPDLFHLPTITYLQAFFLHLLCGIFFFRGGTPEIKYEHQKEVENESR